MLFLSLFLLLVCSLPHALYYDGSCYQLQSGYDNYDNATAKCEALTPQHHLVVLNDAAEEDFVKNLISKDFRLWVGCTDNATDTWICQDESRQQWTSSAETGYWSKILLNDTETVTLTKTNYKLVLFHGLLYNTNGIKGNDFYKFRLAKDSLSCRGNTWTD